MSEPGPQRRVLVTLCVTVSIAYGVLYYAFTVLAPGITEDTGWSTTAVTAAFSAGSLFSALAGVVAGRVMQRRGPRVVMTTGSIVGAVALVVLATAPSLPVFVLGWLLAGAGGAGTFYPPAFAALTRWYGNRRVQAITTLTLVAGFSSTVFAPLTAYLTDELGWRSTYLVLAGVMLVGSAPAHALFLRLPWEAPVHEDAGPVRSDRSVITSRTFLLVAASGTLAYLAMFASLVHLVPLLLERDMGVQLAAWGLGLSGAGQFVGRVMYPTLDRRLAPTPRATLVMGAVALTLLALAWVPGPVALVMAIAIVAGAARGTLTLINATVVSDHWGPERYAALNGVYNAPLGIAAALAPAFGAAVATWTGSYAAMFAVIGVIGLAATGLAAMAREGSR